MTKVPTGDKAAEEDNSLADGEGKVVIMKDVSDNVVVQEEV